MTKSMRPSRALFAAAMIALGLTGLVNDDFALVWQRIPVQQLPGRAAVAYACALIELLAGIGLLVESFLTPACRVLFPYMLLWIVLLKLPVVASAPGKITSWAAFGEIAMITAGSWCLFAEYAGEWEKRHLGFAVGQRGVRAARWVLVVSLPMIGLVVLLKGESYRLPAWLTWLPHPVGWVYLSGLGSIAACCGMFFGVWPRLAAAMEAAMLGVVTIWFWGPILGTGRTAVTGFVVSSLIVAGAWVSADSYVNLPWLAVGRPIWSISEPNSDNEA